MGIENELTEADIAKADVAIIATDIVVEKASRFDKVRKIEVPVRQVLKDPMGIFSRI
jgi:fructose-specific phosphotransferase system component IIB